MSDGLIPKRYAKALYKYANEMGDAEKIYEHLKDFNFRETAIDDLKRAVRNPNISDENKGELLSQVMDCKNLPTLNKFILLVVRNNRAEYLRRISLAYIDLYREEHNIAHVIVTAACKLQEKELDEIVGVVRKQLPDMQLEVEQTIDPELIGGFVVRIGSLVLDASVKTELNNLRLKLNKT